MLFTHYTPSFPEPQTRAEIPFSWSEQAEISGKLEEIYTTDYSEDITQKIFSDPVSYIKEKYDVDVTDPTVETVNAIGSRQGLGHQAYAEAKNNYYNQIYTLRLENPDDEQLKLIPASDEELDEIIATRSMNRIMANRTLNQSFYKHWTAQMWGAMGAQFSDSTQQIYLATLPLTIMGVGLLPTALLRVSALMGEAMLGNTLAEYIQQKGSEAIMEKINISLDNPEVREDLMNIGVDPDNLNITKEELNTRLIYAWASGALVGGTIYGVSQLGRSLLKRSMQGSVDAMKAVDDTVKEINTVYQKELMKNMTAKEGVEHIRKLAQKTSELQFQAPYVHSRTVKFKPNDYAKELRKQKINNIEKDIDIFEKTILKEGEKYTKKQRRIIRALIDEHNFQLDVENAILKGRVWDGERLILDPLNDIAIKEHITTLKEAFTNMLSQKVIAKTLKMKPHLKNAVDDALKQAGLDDIDKFMKGLPKGADKAHERARLLGNANARASLLKDLLTQKVRNESRLGRYMPLTQLTTDLLDVSYMRGVIPNNVASVQRGIFQDFANFIDDPALHSLNLAKGEGFDDVNIVRYIFGEATDDEVAGTIGKGMTEAFENARILYNHYGGNIPAYKRGYFPQGHQAEKVGQVSADDWADELLNGKLLDDIETSRRFGIDEKIIGTPEGAIQLRTHLQRTHRHIVGEDMEYSLKQIKKGGEHKSRDSAMRYLIFKDADSFLKYNTSYGQTPLKTAMNYLNHMANEIALMKIFGPNVADNAKWIQKFASTFDNTVRGYKKDSQAFNNLFDHMIGADQIMIQSTIPGMKTTWGSFMQGARNLLISAQLGGAFLMTQADHAYQHITRRLINMRQSGQVRDYLKNLVGNKQQAREANVTLHQILEDVRHETRMAGDTFGDGWTSWLARKMMRVSLLQPGTIASRTAFKMELQHHFKKLSRTAWGDIDKETKFMYTRYGITRADHEELAKTKLYTSTLDAKVTYLRASDIKDPEVRQKFWTFMFSETEAAVPSYLARTRAFMLRSNQPGTGMGEISRSFWLFKNFPMTIMFTHIARAINVIGTKGLGHHRITYPLMGLSLTSFLGYMIFGTRKITYGEDVPPMNSKTLAQGIMYGGGLGYFGDLFLHDSTRYGQSWLGAAAGPVWGLINDGTTLLGAGQFVSSLSDNRNFIQKLPARLIRFADKYTPFNNLWYTRAATDRLIFQNLRMALDPDWESKLLKKMRRLQKEGSGMWLSPTGFEMLHTPKLQFFDYKKIGD